MNRDDAPSDPSARARTRTSWLSRIGVVPKVLGGVTAVLSLAFAIRQASIYVGDHRHKQQRVNELLATARLQRESHDYRAAWRSLAEAGSLDIRNRIVQTEREDLAMDWLQNARAPQGTTLGAIGDTVAVVLTRGVVTARGSRKADLIAHLGWADFLRWRDGQRQLDPAARYRQSLETDPRNVYGHAMLGHWMMWTGDSLPEAKHHFAAAAASGRERAFARDLELAAFSNVSSDEGMPELLRIANDMRAQGDSAGESTRSRLWPAHVWLLHGANPGVRRAGNTLSAANLLETYRWLYATSSYPRSRGPTYSYYLAKLEEAAGDRAQALASYRAARAQATGARVYLPPEVDAAIARLSRSR
jgi:hypothetical protein